MSRAYRVRVTESLRTTVRGEDNISGRVELLAILPPEEMAGIVVDELATEGFECRADGTMVRVEGDVEIAVDPRTGTVTARAQTCKEVDLQTVVDHSVIDDRDAGMTEEAWQERVAQARESLRGQAQASLDARAAETQLAARREATAALEKALTGIRPVLDAAVNRATVAALKRRAAQMGTIKEISEEPDGSMTIRVEL